MIEHSEPEVERFFLSRLHSTPKNLAKLRCHLFFLLCQVFTSFSLLCRIRKPPDLTMAVVQGMVSWESWHLGLGAGRRPRVACVVIACMRPASFDRRRIWNFSSALRKAAMQRPPETFATACVCTSFHGAPFRSAAWCKTGRSRSWGAGEGGRGEGGKGGGGGAGCRAGVMTQGAFAPARRVCTSFHAPPPAPDTPASAPKNCCRFCSPPPANGALRKSAPYRLCLCLCRFWPHALTPTCRCRGLKSPGKFPSRHQSLRTRWLYFNAQTTRMRIPAPIAPPSIWPGWDR